MMMFRKYFTTWDKISRARITGPYFFMTDTSDKKIILFDGICNFCNYWVNFALKRDKKNQLFFTTLQGETAKEILPEFGLSATHITSVIFIDNGTAYTQSSAAIRICRYLGGGWSLFYVFIIMPKFVRDPLYNIIARNRYRWFGKKDTCMVPAPETRNRFLP